MDKDLIKTLIEGANLPKRAFDNAEALFKKLFGEGLTEVGGMLGDAIRSRSFKNQVNIFSKAQELLKSKGLEPKQINLKLLVPLVEYSSLEENETIQNKWANIIANIVADDSNDVFNKKCISILSELSNKEIQFLDNLYNGSEVYELDRVKKTTPYRKIELQHKGLFRQGELLFSGLEVDFFLERLNSFGLVIEKKPILKKMRNNRRHRPSEGDDYLLETTDRYHLTNFGIYFIELCKFEK